MRSDLHLSDKLKKYFSLIIYPDYCFKISFPRVCKDKFMSLFSVAATAVPSPAANPMIAASAAMFNWLPRLPLAAAMPHLPHLPMSFHLHPAFTGTSVVLF